MTTVAATARAFLTPFAYTMKNRGWVVHLATSGPSDDLVGPFELVYSVPWTRSPLALWRNISGGFRIRKIVSQGAYDIVHVHTPIAAFVTRLFLFGRITRSTTIIYTAHGFHFNRNGGVVSNLIYKIAEWAAGRLCHTIIVINEEDYRSAVALWDGGSPQIVYMPGIGIDLEQYSRAAAPAANSHVLRKDLGVPPNGRIAVMIAEFNLGKRHKDAIMALAQLSCSDVYMVFAGAGPLLGATIALARSNGVLHRCRFLGHVDYIPSLIAAADVVVLPSQREGLPRAVMEAMAIGVPVVGADSRGIRDLLAGGCGLLHEVGDVEGFSFAIRCVLDDREFAAEIVRRARDRISAFDINILKLAHEQLYTESVKEQFASSIISYSSAPPCRKRIIVSGGVARSLINFRGELIKEFRNRGWEVICTAFDRHPETLKQLWLWGVDFRHIPLSRTGISPMADWRYFLRVRILSKWFRPDRMLCYTHKPVVYTALACGGRGAGCVGIVSGLGYAFTEDLGFSLHREWTRFVLMALMFIAFRRLDGAIFQNPDDRELLREKWVSSKHLPTIVVPGSGVDLQKFSSSSWSGHCPVFVFVGRTLRSKGILEFLEACARVRSELIQCRFLLIGGTDSNPDAVDMMDIQEHARAGGVEIFGEVDDVRPYIEMASALVLPSYREGLPRTALEAMAMSRAIIVTDVPGCRETVFGVGGEGDCGLRIGRNGVLVRVRDVNSLVAGMRYIGNNSEIARKMGVEGRRLAEEWFDVRLVNEKILRFVVGAG